MMYLLAAGLILSLIVRYWPGHPGPPWICTWIDRLWTLLGVTFLIGMVLGFFNTTTTVLPNGGFRYSWATPQPIQYVLAAICIALGILAVLGAIDVARSEARAYSLFALQAGTAAAAGRFRKIGISLAVALAAILVSWGFGGPLTLSTNEGYSNVWPFAVDAVAAIVFFAALGSAWTAAKTPHQVP
jgi:hypothetical protein